MTQQRILQRITIVCTFTKRRFSSSSSYTSPSVCSTLPRRFTTTATTSKSSRKINRNLHDKQKLLLYMDTELTTRRLLDGSAATYSYTRQIFNDTLNKWANIARELTLSATNTKEQQQQQQKLQQHRTRTRTSGADVDAGIDMPTVSHVVDRAVGLLRFMEDESDTRTSARLEIKPNSVSYNSALKVIAVIGDIDRACALFVRMQELGVANTISLNTTLHAFAVRARCKSISISAEDECSVVQIGERAEAIVNGVKKCGYGDEIKTDNVQPDIRTYNTLVNIWANSRCVDSIERAVGVVRRMKHQFNLSGDVITLNTLLKALAKSRILFEKGQQAESLLVLFENEHGVSPNERTLATLLNVWAKSFESNAAYKAEEILKRMETLAHGGFHSFQPHLVAYTTVIDAFANCATRDKNAADKAASILEKMLVLTETRGDEFQPNVVTCNSVIKAYAKSRSRDSADKARDLLNRMLRLSEAGLTAMSPDIISFNTVLLAFANSKDPKAWVKAISVLTLLKKLSLTGKLRISPDLVTYTTLFQSLKINPNKESLALAENILNEMEEIGKNKIDIIPDNRCFTMVIGAYAKSSETRKAWKAKQMLDRMKANGVKVDLYTYTAALSACRNFTSNDLQPCQVFDILTDIIRQMKLDDINPNEVTYAVILEATVRLCTDATKRNLMLNKYFTACCSDGYVTNRILNLVPADIVGVPKVSWTRSIPQQSIPKYKTFRSGKDIIYRSAL